MPTTKSTVSTVAPAAAADLSGHSLINDFHIVFGGNYVVTALLHGAESLLDDFAAVNPDGEGKVWSALEIIRTARERAEKMTIDVHELRIFERIEGAEGGVQ